jgi:hypothetical protein
VSDHEPETGVGPHMRACFNPLLLDRVGKELLLPDTRMDFRETPDRLLMILFASRAGSTYAGQLLANTPYFHRVAETFNRRSAPISMTGRQSRRIS